MRTKIATDFSAQLKKLRGDLSRRALAKAIGVSPGIIAKWETGEALPTLGKLELIAKHFEVRIGSLVEGDDGFGTEGLDAADRLLNELTPALTAMRLAVRAAQKKEVTS